MALDYDALMNHVFDEVEHTYTRRDTALYALGVGLGHDPLDEAQCAFSSRTTCWPCRPCR